MSQEGNHPMTNDSLDGRERGVHGDYSEDANALARRVWRAKARGTGCYLTADMVVALHSMEGDGDWWQSFDPDLQKDSAS